MPAPSAPAAVIPEVDAPPVGPLPAVVAVAVVAATVMFPSPYVLHLWSPASRNYFTATVLLPADLGLLLVVVTSLPVLLAAGRRRRIGPGARVWAAAAAALLLAFPWHPSGRGCSPSATSPGAPLWPPAARPSWRRAGGARWRVPCAVSGPSSR